MQNSKKRLDGIRMGLQDTHSYTITGLAVLHVPGENVSLPLIKLKNPNSFAMEWKGRYSDE